MNPLAHLQIFDWVRLCSLRDMAKARTAYQEFLMLWKDADRDIPNPQGTQGRYANSGRSQYQKTQKGL